MSEEFNKFKFRNEKVAKDIIEQLNNLELELSIMHVCGTHQDTLVKHGLEGMLRDVGIRILQGPGCPVCVTTPREVEEILALARNGITVTAFGDMIKVPGVNSSLYEARSQGADVRIVYSVDDAVDIADKIENDVVFMSVGFETTSPSTAAVIAKRPSENFSILPCNRVVPPALEAILSMGELKLDGLIEPGHVSTIIGTKPYEPLSERYHIPQVVAGFEPVDLLMAVLMIARQVKSGRAEVENEYTRVVKSEGNLKALELLDQVFVPVDVEWRGFPKIPGSGYKLKKEYGSYDARDRFPDILEPIADMEFHEPEGCLCGEVLRGLIDSRECPMFGTECTPMNPIGPCMVSSEGSCNIAFRYR